jgi:hypothetical protein
MKLAETFSPANAAYAPFVVIRIPRASLSMPRRYVAPPLAAPSRSVCPKRPLGGAPEGAVRQLRVEAPWRLEAPARVAIRRSAGEDREMREDQPAQLVQLEGQRWREAVPSMVQA